MKTMKQFLSVVFFMVLVSDVIAQKQISEKEVKTVAVNALRMFNESISNVVLEETIDTINTLEKNGNTLLYEVIFNTGKRMILSGHRGCVPVLGIITSMNNDVESVFSENELLPDAFRIFIDEYARQAESCFENNQDESYNMDWEMLLVNNVGRNENTVFIPPLLTTEWGQHKSNDQEYYDPCAYNANSPSGTYCSHCYAGCSAVAMSQIVKYWAYPKEIPYNCKTYNFSMMPNKLIRHNNSSYESQKESVAGLIYDCGVAMDMVFCSDTESTSAPNSCQSSTYSLQQIIKAFKSYGYSDVVSDMESDYATHDEWVDRVSTELFDQHPIYYAAYRQNSVNNVIVGHAFVCDGYLRHDACGKLFHFNWGWNGESDGSWFTLDNLNPSYTYDLYHQGVFNIYPTNCWNDIIMECNVVFPENASKEYSTRNCFKNNCFGFIMNSGSEIQIQAGEEIFLTNGFYAEEGSDFSAEIAPCGNPARGMGNGNCPNGDSQSFVNVPETSPTGLNIFPNPANTSIVVRGENLKQIEITNMLGQRMVTHKVEDKEIIIDISHLVPGIYFVGVIDENGNRCVQKVVKD